MKKHRTVMVFGSFDVLHDGHRKLFWQAKQHAEQLTVVVAKDKTYETIRGFLPLHNENTRRSHVQAESAVDTAVLGNIADPYQVIREHRPEVIALGYDQTQFVDKLDSIIEQYKLQTRVLRMKEHNPAKYKSSILKKSLSLE